MDGKLNLYELVTGLGKYYVVSTDPTSAQNKLNKMLSITDYGYTNLRKVTSINLIAEEMHEGPFGQTGRNLLV